MGTVDAMSTASVEMMKCVTVSAGLVTSQSNTLQLLVTLTKKELPGSYLLIYFLKNVTSYFTRIYKK